MDKNGPPTQKQLDMIAKIAGSSLFACKTPETQAEAYEIILNWISPLRRHVPPMLDIDKLFVKGKHE